MKIKILFGIAAIFAFASIALSQTVIIQPKKMTYTRKGKVSLKEKRTFTVTYPLFNGKLSPAAKKKLADTISYWRVFETSLQENLSEYDSLMELYYKVNYNKNGILSIALTQESMGAYPTQSTVNLVVNLKTGEQVKFSDVFRADALDKFADAVNKKLSAETNEIIERINKGEFDEGGTPDKEANDSIKEQLKNLSFTAETFNEFTIDDRGMTIIYDAGFPHVIKAAQPDGRYFFNWSEIKPFIKTDGLLGKFIR